MAWSGRLLHHKGSYHIFTCELKGGGKLFVYIAYASHAVRYLLRPISLQIMHLGSAVTCSTLSLQ